MALQFIFRILPRIMSNSRVISIAEISVNACNFEFSFIFIISKLWILWAGHWRCAVQEEHTTPAIVTFVNRFAINRLFNKVRVSKPGSAYTHQVWSAFWNDFFSQFQTSDITGTHHWYTSRSSAIGNGYTSMMISPQPPRAIFLYIWSKGSVTKPSGVAKFVWNAGKTIRYGNIRKIHYSIILFI